MTTNISEELPARKNAPAVGSKSPDKKAEAKGGTPQENSAKRIRQAVYDIRYRARREDVDLRKAYSEYMANSNLSPQEKTAVREKLFGKQGGGVSEQYMVTSVDWAEKNFANAYHKVFVEGIKKEESPIELPYEQELAEEPERKYKVRVFDPKSEKSYVRFATREKISKLRAKGLKVEMTEHGEAYEGERKKGEQTAAAMGGGEKKKDVKEAKLDPVGKEDGDVDNDGDKDKTDDYLMNRRKAVGKAIANKKKIQKEQTTDYRASMAAPIPEEFITDGATGTTSTEGQNAREIDVLPDKIAMKLKQVTVMPQDGTNPQAGRAPLMASHQIEGEQLTEEEEDRRERYAFMNVARNLVRAKTGAKRPIAMDPEGTYKKAKEDLAKMVNSENPDKDRKESPCEEKHLSMADTFKQIAENAADKVKNAADKDAKDEAEKKLESKQEVKTPTVEPKSKDTTTPNTNLNTTTKSDTKTQSSGGGQTKTSKSSGPSGAAPSSDGGGGGMTNKERISRVDAGKDPYPMLSQDEKLRKSLGIRSASEVPDASNLLKKMGLEPGTQPDYLNRNNPENMPRPGAPAPKVKPTPKVKPADLKVKTEGKQLSMTDTIKQITSAPKEDTEQLDEFAGKAAAENVEKLLNRGRQVFDRLGIPNNETSRPTVTKDQQQEKIKKNVK